MGYTTKFEGELRFTSDVTGSQLAFLRSLFWKSDRDEPGMWAEHSPDTDGGYIQFEITKDFTGIQWDGSEKFYDAVGAVNVIVGEMRKMWPDFGLSGHLDAQGENFEDRWQLVIDEDGRAFRRENPRTGQIGTCPRCDHTFEITEAANG